MASGVGICEGTLCRCRCCPWPTFPSCNFSQWMAQAPRMLHRFACVVHVNKHRSGTNLIHMRAKQTTTQFSQDKVMMNEVRRSLTQSSALHSLPHAPPVFNKQAQMNLIWQYKKSLVQSLEPATRAYDGVQVASLRKDFLTEIEILTRGLCTW